MHTHTHTNTLICLIAKACYQCRFHLALYYIIALLVSDHNQTCGNQLMNVFYLSSNFTMPSSYLIVFLYTSFLALDLAYALTYALKLALSLALTHCCSSSVILSKPEPELLPAPACAAHAGRSRTGWYRWRGRVVQEIDEVRH